MSDPVSTADARAVQNAVTNAFKTAFRGSSPQWLADAFARAEDCFAGRYPGYQAIDARYHDLEHTMQGTLCLARLLSARHAAAPEPQATAELFELAIIAALLHDTGYLKPNSDREGTGAKYTLTHVSRSAEFAGRLLPQMGFAAGSTRSVQNMIRCTGINADLGAIQFQNELERTLGCALATADLLGQMAASDYIEKLPLLFEEFAESARFNNQKAIPGGFASAAELIANTPAFWNRYVLPKIENDFGGLHRFLAQPFPDGANPYVQRIEANIARIRQVVAS